LKILDAPGGSKNSDEFFSSSHPSSFDQSISKNSEELEGLKYPDKEQGGKADLRVLLFLMVGDAQCIDEEKGGVSRPSAF